MFEIVTTVTYSSGFEYVSVDGKTVHYGPRKAVKPNLQHDDYWQQYVNMVGKDEADRHLDEYLRRQAQMVCS